MTLPSPSELLQWQIGFYTERLAEEKRPEAKRLLRQTLYNLKQSSNGTRSNSLPSTGFSRCNLISNRFQQGRANERCI